MPPLVNLSGRQFSRLVVIRQAGVDKWGHSRWLCRCSCGTEKIIVGYNLTDMVATSCGCFNIEQIIKRSTKHGHTPRSKMSLTYKTWAGMIQRCTNPNEPSYDRYGGRGISVCDRWSTFENFLKDMGERLKNQSIDRIDNDGNYCKSNCRWASSKDQGRNKRNNHLISFGGKTRCISFWEEKYGLSRGTIYKRLSLGWSEEKALTEPIKKKGEKNE